jgi:hypothetical protein
MKVNLKTTCDGDSYWSNEPGRIVDIYDLGIGYLDEGDEDSDGEVFGELRAYFKTSTWDPYKYGLIYTDKGWMDSFRKCLTHIGFTEAEADDVYYSEQGMQGATYVSMDFGGLFYSKWKQLNS